MAYCDGPRPGREYDKHRGMYNGVVVYHIPQATSAFQRECNAKIIGRDDGRINPFIHVQFEQPIDINGRGEMCAGAPLCQESLNAFIRLHKRAPMVGEILEGTLVIDRRPSEPNRFEGFIAPFNMALKN